MIFYLMIAYIVYLVVINVISFALMGIDKRKSVKGRWRISEKALFTSALAGGALGSCLGMSTFRHKTKHWYFVVGMPLLVVAWVMISVLVFDKVFIPNL